jgi:O-antigen ligase
MSADEPITGYGPGAFYNNYKSYTITSFRTWVSRNSEGSTTHNYFLMLLTEQGWPAMLLYAIFLIVFFAKAQNIYHQFNDKFYKAATMGVAMCMAASFVNNFFSELIETHKMGGLFYLCIAVLILLQHKLQLEKTATVTANKQQDK